MSAATIPEHATLDDAALRARAAVPKTWKGTWKKAALVGGVGLAASFAGAAAHPARFAASYLFAFLAFLTVAAGALVFVLLQHLTNAAWSVTVRRCAELLMAGLPIFLALAIPVAATTTRIYPWDGAPRPAEIAQGGAFANAVDEGDREPAALRVANGGMEPELAAARAEEDAHANGARHVWLNRPFFVIRLFLHLGLWTYLASRLFRWSTQDDERRDVSGTRRSRRWAPLGMIAVALSINFASFDWIMSLEANWYSTIMGVYVFAGCMLSMSAALVLFALILRRRGVLRDVVSIEHYHDMGKAMFAWLCFWAYVLYVQFFLAWYANVPTEIAFFHHRWTESGGSWKWLSFAMAATGFAAPFLLLSPRAAKRNVFTLVVSASIVFVMHFLEIYWLVMPCFGAFAPHWLDLTCLIGVGGAYLAAVTYAMERHPLVPLGDPQLARSLAFENE